MRFKVNDRLSQFHLQPDLHRNSTMSQAMRLKVTARRMISVV